MASQNHDTGFTTYFQPMATGYQKVFNTLDGNFWCCTGTGYENFTKLQDGVFRHVHINLYDEDGETPSTTYATEVNDSTSIPEMSFENLLQMMKSRQGKVDIIKKTGS